MDSRRTRESESIQSDVGESSYQGRKRSLTDGNQTPPRKKSKVVTACTQCIRRKSRCEVLGNEAGFCHRCVVLQTDCSLRGSNPGNTSSVRAASLASGGVSVPSSGRESPDRLGDELHSRLDRIEDRLDQLLDSKPQLDSEPEIQPTEIDWASIVGNGSSPSRTISTFSYGLIGRPLIKFESPVALGIVSPIELKFLHERFVTVCKDIFQVVGLGISSVTPPTHPFVQSAMLYFTACMKDATVPMRPEQRDASYALMSRQMSVVLRRDPCEDILLGLIILAHSPAPQKPHNDIYRDPFRANTLAYNMAIELGLEDSVRKLSRHRDTEINWDQSAMLLHDVCLWYSACHRYTWSRVTGHGQLTSISHSPPLYLTVPFGTPFVQESSLMMHLWHESEMLDAMDFGAESATKLRIERQFHQHYLDDFARDSDRTVARLLEIRGILQKSTLSSKSYLILETYHLAYCAGLQGSLTARMLPMPLAAQMRFDTLVRFGGRMVIRLGEYLWHLILTRPDLSTLPSYILPSLYLAIATIRGWNLGGALEHPNRPGIPLDVESIHQIVLEDLVSGRAVLDRIMTTPAYYKVEVRQVPRPDEPPLTNGVHVGSQADGRQVPTHPFAPAFQTFDAYGNDMSWLMDFEADWMNAVNARPGGF